VCYSLWHNAPTLLMAGSLEMEGTKCLVRRMLLNESSNILRTEHLVSALRLQATGHQQHGCIMPQAVTHSLALLKMGKKLPRNMLS